MSDPLLHFSQEFPLNPVIDIGEGTFSFSLPNEGSQRYDSDVAEPDKLFDNLQRNGYLGILKILTDPSVDIGPKPTSREPALFDFHGPLNFEMEVGTMEQEKNQGNSKKNKLNWVLCNKLKKIFIKKEAVITLQFLWNNSLGPSYPLYIRATPVYASPDFLKTPVLRCPNHKQNQHNEGVNPQIIEHVLRCEKKDAFYIKDEQSERLSVKVPVKGSDPAALGIDIQEKNKSLVCLDYKFVCETSCTGGMERRYIYVIFTLEDANGVVFGRITWPFKICACPRRDMKRELLDWAVCGGEPDIPPCKIPSDRKPEKAPAQESPEDKVDRCFFNVLELLPSEQLLELRALLAGRYYKKENDKDPKVQDKWLKLIR